MLKMIRGWRAVAGGRGRVFRLVLVLVFGVTLCWVLSTHGEDPSHVTQQRDPSHMTPAREPSHVIPTKHSGPITPAKDPDRVNVDSQLHHKDSIKNSETLKEGDDWRAAEEDFKTRRARVREVCRQYNLGPDAKAGSRPLIKHPPTPNYDVFYIDRRDGLAWCPVFKAASTNWMFNFVVLGGLTEAHVTNSKDQVATVARRLWPNLDYTQAEMSLKMCLKFLIVRHPFERLVSAFRDKLENTNVGAEHGTQHFYQKYGRKIVEKYRGKDPPNQPKLPQYSQDKDDPSIPPPKGIEPTFREFVRYLIDTDLVYYADDHWLPYYLACTPCMLQYDVIAKFETLQRDQAYVIRDRKLQDKLTVGWKHLTKGKKTGNVVQKYFSTITKEELLKLYKKYKVDFELFGYSMDEYLSYVS